MCAELSFRSSVKGCARMKWARVEDFGLIGCHLYGSEATGNLDVYKTWFSQLILGRSFVLLMHTFIGVSPVRKSHYQSHLIQVSVNGNFLLLMWPRAVLFHSSFVILQRLTMQLHQEIGFHITISEEQKWIVFIRLFSMLRFGFAHCKCSPNVSRWVDAITDFWKTGS